MKKTKFKQTTEEKKNEKVFVCVCVYEKENERG